MKSFFLFSFLVFCPVLAAAQDVPSAEKSSKEPQRLSISSSLVQSAQAYDHFLSGYVLQQEGDAIGAVREYSEVLRLCPEAAFVYQDRAKLYSSLGNNEGALEDAQKYRQSNPGAAADLLLAGIYVQQEKKEEAQKILRESLKTNPDNAQMALLLSALLEEQDWKQSVQVLEKFQEKNPNDPDVLNRMAFIYESNGQAEKAKKTLKTIVQTNPDSAIALVLQGQQAEEKNRPLDAIDFYYRSLEKAPQNDALRKHLVGLCSRNRQYQRIVDLLREDQKNPKASTENLQWLASSYEILGKTKEALEHYVLVQQKKDTPELRFHIAYLYGVENQPERTLEQIAPLLKESPNDPKLRYMRALAYKDLKEFKKSLRDLRLVAKMNPQQLSARFQTAVVLDELNRGAEAERELRYVVDKDSSIAAVNNYLAYTWISQRKNLSQARALLELALADEPDNPAYLDSMGWLYFQEGNAARAKDYLLKAAELEEDATIFEHLADAFYQLDELEWAAFYYEKAERLEPDNKTVKKKLADVATLKTTKAEAMAALQRLSDITASVNQVSGVLTLRLRGGPAKILGPSLGQGAFYLRKIVKETSDVLEMKIDFANPFPSVPMSFYYQTPPKEEWRIFPPEAAAQIPPDSKIIFEVIAAFFNGDLLRLFDSPQTFAMQTRKTFVLSSQNESLEIEKKESKFVRWSLPDMNLSVEKYQTVDGQNFPQTLRLRWKSNPNDSTWNVLDIDLTQISLETIPDQVFE